MQAITVPAVLGRNRKASGQQAAGWSGSVSNEDALLSRASEREGVWETGRWSGWV